MAAGSALFSLLAEILEVERLLLFVWGRRLNLGEKHEKQCRNRADEKAAQKPTKATPILRLCEARVDQRQGADTNDKFCSLGVHTEIFLLPIV